MKKNMPKKWFYKHLMSSEFDGSKLVKGRYYKDEKVAEIHDGAVVRIGDLESHSVYNYVKDLDVRKITTPISETDEIGIVDLVNVSEGKIAENTYREGIKTVGLTIGAGIPVRVRKLQKGDSFYLASGNFIGTIEEGKFAIPTKDDTRWTIVDKVESGKTIIKIDFILPLIEGTVITDDKILCSVVQVACPVSDPTLTIQVIDNLYSDEKNAALSANQGKILKNMIENENKIYVETELPKKWSLEKYNVGDIWYCPSENKAFICTYVGIEPDATFVHNWEKMNGVGDNFIETSEIFNDYENNKIYGRYSHAENKVGIIGDESHIYKIIASHFENQSNANIQAYNSMFLFVDNDKKPTELHRDLHDVSQVIDDVKVGDIIIVELSEKAKLYAIVSENFSYRDDSGYHVVYQFNEYYLTDGFTFSESIDNAKTLILRYDSKAKGYTVVQTPVDKMVSTIEDSHGEGSTTITDSYQHGEGYNTKPYGKGSHTEGKDTVTFGDYAHAEGNGSAAFGFSSHGEGSETRAIGSWSHAEGKVSYSYGSYSHAEGCKTNSIGGGSHAEGISTIAHGIGSHSEGQGSKASADQSHAEGSGTISSGFASHAEGSETKAIGIWSHTEGCKTEATKETAHAEGYMSKATAVHSHAEGQNTLASGDHSHSEGIATIASGINSHAEGLSTRANGMNQHVQGKYNIEDTNNKYADIIGNGIDTDNRANIQTTDWNGNIWAKGNIKIGGISYDDTNAKELATVDVRIKSIELTADADGKITGGTATLQGGTTIPITIKTV